MVHSYLPSTGVLPRIGQSFRRPLRRWLACVLRAEEESLWVDRRRGPAVGPAFDLEALGFLVAVDLAKSLRMYSVLSSTILKSSLAVRRMMAPSRVVVPSYADGELDDDLLPFLCALVSATPGALIRSLMAWIACAIRRLTQLLGGFGVDPDALAVLVGGRAL